MGKVVKGLGWTFAGIGIFAITFYILAYLKSENSRNQIVKVDVVSVQLPTDEASIKEGQRLAQVKSCTDCHGVDLAGGTLANDPMIGYLGGPNITPGASSKTKNYSVEDWVRAIRYSVGPDGRKLILMPAPDYVRLTNEEVAKLIAYLKTVKPVDKENPQSHPGPLARVLYTVGQMPNLFPYEEVDLNVKAEDSIKVEPTAAYGKYLANACSGCHGNGFSGGQIPGVPPDWPKAANLTPSGDFANYDFEAFERVLRNGKTKEGREINPQYMPWKSFSAMTDVEVRALYTYLKSLDPRPAGTR